MPFVLCIRFQIHVKQPPLTRVPGLSGGIVPGPGSSKAIWSYSQDQSARGGVFALSQTTDLRSRFTPLYAQAHLGTCSYNVVPCPNRCGTKLSRRDLPPHLQHDCPQRHLKCEFCGVDFTGEAYEVSMWERAMLWTHTVSCSGICMYKFQPFATLRCCQTLERDVPIG